MEAKRLGRRDGTVDIAAVNAELVELVKHVRQITYESQSWNEFFLQWVFSCPARRAPAQNTIHRPVFLYHASSEDWGIPRRTSCCSKCETNVAAKVCRTRTRPFLLDHEWLEPLLRTGFKSMWTPSIFTLQNWLTLKFLKIPDTRHLFASILLARVQSQQNLHYRSLEDGVSLKKSRRCSSSRCV